MTGTNPQSGFTSFQLDKGGTGDLELERADKELQLVSERLAAAASTSTSKEKTPTVLESHQASKLDTFGTAKAVISSFPKLGVSFDMDQIQQIRDPEQQVQMVGIPEEYLNGHAFHMYHLSSSDEPVSFEFQHNVCGRSIYAEGAIDVAIFLAKK